MITIVNYGMGNLGSICNMFRRVGVATAVTGDPETIAKATKLLLPGVGAFDHAMERINEIGLRRVLDEKVLHERVPILGVCLGMQLLTKASEEGDMPGLGWIAASAKKFSTQARLKVPHMGWNDVCSTRQSCLTHDLPHAPRFYFVHSYYVCVESEEDSILKATYGITFDAAVQHDNIYGAQFHPEKSHKYGMAILRNFARL